MKTSELKPEEILKVKYSDDKWEPNFNGILEAMQEYADNQNKELKERIKKLEFMIENGLGWDDMKNDITMPHDI